MQLLTKQLKIKENISMKAKILGCISLAVALGATASGTVLLQKPTLINSTVYVNTPKSTSSTTIKDNKNIKKISVILYESKPINQSNINKNNPEYIATEGQVKRGDLTQNSKNWTFIGQAVLKDTPGNIKLPNGPGFTSSFLSKKTVEIPVGTKLNVIFAIGNMIAIDYNGTEAFVSKDYFNMSNVLTNKYIIMQKESKEYLKTAHYIGTAKVKNSTDSFSNKIVNKPQILVLFNGAPYHLSLKAGTKVNVIKEANEVNIKVHNNPNIRSISYPLAAVVEYDGIAGTIAGQNLGPMTK